MPNKISNILSRFQKRILMIEKIRSNQESLFLNGVVNKSELEEFYGAIFINAIATFEAYIEERFFSLLVGTGRNRTANIIVKCEIKDHKIARGIILREKKYYSWLPYKNTEKIANIFFTKGRPFTLLTENEKQVLKASILIRNAIAHQSKYSIKKFKSEVTENLNILTRDKQPKKILRAVFSGAPRKLYFRHYIENLVSIAIKIF